jgi:hypothetical protein
MNENFLPVDATEAPAPVDTPMTTAAPVSMVKSKFHFKTEKLRDAEGNEIGTGKKHPSVEIDLPIPSIRTLQAYLGDTKRFGKELELLFSTLQDQVYRIARGQINDFREKSLDAVVTAASLDYDKLSWSAIANMPKGERASTVPSDEDTKAFLDSYLQVMPEALSKPKKNIENHIACFTASFKKQKSQKEILEMFLNALAVYVSTVGEETVEEHMEVLEYYQNRLEKLLKSEEKITMDNL